MLCGINRDLLCGNVDINPDTKALCDIGKKMPHKCHFIVPTLHILFNQFVNYILQVHFSEFHLNWVKASIASLMNEIDEFNAKWSHHLHILYPAFDELENL
jgi:hypothetical protein